MTAEVQKLFSAVSPSGLISAVTGLFNRNYAELEQLIPMKRVDDAEANAVPTRVDQIRYEQMLERELDRQLLTQVEREDTDMLDRVRNALYAD